MWCLSNSEKVVAQEELIYEDVTSARICRGWVRGSTCERKPRPWGDLLPTEAHGDVGTTALVAAGWSEHHNLPWMNSGPLSCGKNLKASVG